MFPSSGSQEAVAVVDSFDPFSIESSEDDLVSPVSLGNMFEKEKRHAIRFKKKRGTTDEDDYTATDSETKSSTASKAKILVVQSQDGAEEIFAKAFGNHDFVVSNFKNDKGSHNSLTKKSNHSCGDDDIDSTAKSFEDEDDDVKSFAADSVDLSVETGKTDPSNKPQVVAVDASSLFSSFPGKKETLSGTSSVTKKHQQTTTRAGTHGCLSTSSSSTKYLGRSLQSTQSTVLGRKPSPCKKPSRTSLQAIIRTSTSDILGKSSHSSRSNETGVRSTLSAQESPRRRRRQAPESDNCHSMRELRSSDWSVTSGEALNGGSFRGTLNEKIRQRSFTKQSKAQDRKRNAALSSYSGHNLQEGGMDNSFIISESNLNHENADEKIEAMTQRHASVAKHDSQSDEEIIEAMIQKHSARANSKRQGQRYAQQRPHRKESSRSRSGAPCRSNSYQSCSSSSDREDNQITSTNSRCLRRAKSTGRVSIPKALPVRSLRRSASSSRTRSRLVIEEIDGSMTIDPQLIEDLAAKLLEKKTKEKLEKLKSKQERQRSVSPPVSSRGDSRLGAASPSRRKKKASRGPSPVKQKSGLVGTALPSLDSQLNASFIRDFLHARRSGNVEAQMELNQIITAAVIKRLCTKYAVRLSEEELKGMDIISVVEKAAMSHETNQTVEDTPDKHFVDEISKRTFDLAQALQKIPDVQRTSTFLRDYLNAVNGSNVARLVDLNGTLTEAVRHRLTSKYGMVLSDSELVESQKLLTVSQTLARSHESNKTVNVTTDKMFLDQIAKRILDAMSEPSLDASSSHQRVMKTSKAKNAKGPRESSSERERSFEKTTFSNNSKNVRSVDGLTKLRKTDSSPRRGMKKGNSSSSSKNPEGSLGDLCYNHEKSTDINKSLTPPQQQPEKMIAPSQSIGRVNGSPARTQNAAHIMAGDTSPRKRSSPRRVRPGSVSAHV